MTNTGASRSPNDPVGLGLLVEARTISFLFRIDEAIISMSYWRTSRSGPEDGEIWLGLLKPAAKAAVFFRITRWDEGATHVSQSEASRFHGA